MRARALLNRLDSIKLPPRLPDCTVLSPFEQKNYWDLALALHDGRHMSEYHKRYLCGLIDRCPFVDQATYRSRVATPHQDDDQSIKNAFGVVFQNFASKNKNVIAIPHRVNRLCLFERTEAYARLEKYGWAVGDSDCSSIQALEDWCPEDRHQLTALYRLAAPSGLGEPAGWESNFDPRRPFV